MELDNPPSIPSAHQQIRLGDIQASAHKWTGAIDYYLRAIEYFKGVQNSLQDRSLISIIEAQIVQCEKTIHFCRLKDRSEQAIKAEHHSKKTRTHSVSNPKPPAKTNRPIPQGCTLQLKNTGLFDGRGGMDSFAAFIFPNNNPTDNSAANSPPVVAKKNKKHDSHKIEELQTGYEALKTHLQAAFEDIERLKHENNELRIQREDNTSPQLIHSRLLSTSHDEENNEEEPESDLEATL